MWRGSFNLKKSHVFFVLCAHFELFFANERKPRFEYVSLSGELCVFSANSPLGQSHEFASYFYEWKCRMPQNGQQFRWMPPDSTTTATEKLLAWNENKSDAHFFSPLGSFARAKRDNCVAAMGQTQCVCLTHSCRHCRRLGPESATQARHWRGVLMYICVCKCTYQHVFMYILVVLLFCSFNFICAQLELIFGGTNCQAARSPESDSSLASRSASAATWNKSWQQQQKQPQGSSRRHADWHFRYADEGVKIAIRTTVVCFQISPFCSVFGFKFFICFSLS